jgi:phosphatidylglycerophosphate synthase
MDALDGKHARNTGRASPMGQLIDHGLDCISYAFHVAFCVIGQRMGSGWANCILQLFVYV